jgi:hypothetical protein
MRSLIQDKMMRWRVAEKLVVMWSDSGQQDDEMENSDKAISDRFPDAGQDGKMEGSDETDSDRVSVEEVSDSDAKSEESVMFPYLSSCHSLLVPDSNNEQHNCKKSRKRMAKVASTTNAYPHESNLSDAEVVLGSGGESDESVQFSALTHSCESSQVSDSDDESSIPDNIERGIQHQGIYVKLVTKSETTSAVKKKVIQKV